MKFSKTYFSIKIIIFVHHKKGMQFSCAHYIVNKGHYWFLKDWCKSLDRWEQSSFKPPVAYHIQKASMKIMSKFLWWYGRDLYIQTIKLNVLIRHWVFLSNYVSFSAFHLLEFVLLTYFLLFSKFFPLATIAAHITVILLYGLKYFLIFQEQQY